MSFVTAFSSIKDDYNAFAEASAACRDIVVSRDRFASKIPMSPLARVMSSLMWFL